MSEIGLRMMSGIGFMALLGIAWIVSSNRGAIDKRLVGVGVADGAEQGLIHQENPHLLALFSYQFLECFQSEFFA